MEKYPIYELPASEFERLVIDLLSASNLYTNINIGAEGKKDNGFDLTADSKSTHDGKLRRSIIQIKHRRHFSSQEIRADIEKAFNQIGDIYEFVLITSATVLPKYKSGEALLKEFRGAVQKFQLIDRETIINLLDSHPEISQKYFSKVRKAVKRRNLTNIIGIIGSLCSLAGLVLTFFSYGKIEPETSLQKDVIVLEQALDGLKELETNLINLKTEIKNTSQKSARIKKEYEEALKLKDITEEQLSIIRKSLNTQSASKMIINTILGFIFGVASSLTGTVIYEKRKRDKMLQ